MVDDNEEDTIEYDYRNTFVYHPEKNGPGLTGEEIGIFCRFFLFNFIQFLSLFTCVKSKGQMV